MDVVVIGSVNRDVSVMTTRLPRPGETVIGSGHFFGSGGKGANQAVAAARLGARVALIGRVGDDEDGASLVTGLESEQVDVSAISVDEVAATGLAVITIDEMAENTIVGSPGANLTLTPDHIGDHHQLIAEADVVLAQLEVPTETVQAAAEVAKGRFILNPAPARDLPAALLERADVLVPNRSELALLGNGPEPATPSEAAEAVRRLDRDGVTVVTLGRDGAMVVEGDVVTMVPPTRVESVDPTGAGDAFCGALAYTLSRGMSLLDAVRWAAAAGALATTRLGAQTAMPSLGDVEALIGAD